MRSGTHCSRLDGFPGTQGTHAIGATDTLFVNFDLFVFGYFVSLFEWMPSQRKEIWYPIIKDFASFHGLVLTATHLPEPGVPNLCQPWPIQGTEQTFLPHMPVQFLHYITAAYTQYPLIRNSSIRNDWLKA